MVASLCADLLSVTGDLDAVRAARAALRGEHPTFTLDGETFALAHAELPFMVAEAWFTTELGFAGILPELLGGIEESDRFWMLKPSIEDVQALQKWVCDAYGLANEGDDPTGKSPASSGPASSTSGQSRPTSCTIIG